MFFEDGDSNSNFGEWLHPEINMRFPDHVKLSDEKKEEQRTEVSSGRLKKLLIGAELFVVY